MNEPDQEKSAMDAGDAFPSLRGAFVPLPPMDDLSATVTDRRLAVVQARLIANLGNALASWFRIVPSSRAANDLDMVAMLLERHLPILVPVSDLESGSSFLVARYNVDGRRLKPVGQDPGRTAHASLSEALLAADIGFQALKAQAVPEPGPRRVAAPELPEEQWLRHQLARHQTPAGEFNA
jgi:hypothetical protein